MGLQCPRRAAGSIVSRATPGKWTVREIWPEGFSVRAENGAQICRGAALHHAVLLCAAPDLLAACESALDAMVSADCGTVTVVPQLRAAIARATGETP